MRIRILLMLLALLIVPVSAMDITAPAPPDSAMEYLDDETESFSEGLWYVFKTAIAQLSPGTAEAARTCLSLIAVAIVVSILQNLPGSTSVTLDFAGTLAVGLLLLQPSRSLIQMAVQTISQLSEYGRLLLPVMTTAVAAQGGSTTSAGLYTGTALFDAVPSTAISDVLVPLLSVYLCLCTVCNAASQELLKQIKNFIKWGITWFLKILLYVFTGYLGITGVISGSADAAAVKAAKLAMAGGVPVVGGIMSDASETVLVSAAVIKNSAGSYGLLAILAICVMPFLQIGIHYLLLKGTAAICGVFGAKQTAALVKDFSGGMGLLLAMAGTVALLFLISLVCFMKGMA